MVAEDCRVQKIFFSQVIRGKKFKKLKFSQNKKTNFFIMVIRLLREVLKIINKYSFLQNWWEIWM